MVKNNNTWIIILVVVLALFLFVMPYGSGRWGGVCGMMGLYGTNYGFGMMNGYGYSFGWIFMIAFWAAIILLIVWLVKQLQNSGGKK